MIKPVRNILILGFSLVLCSCAREAPDTNILKDGDFERGIVAPWGTDHLSNGKVIWWNMGGCTSKAEIDKNIKKSGNASLHIVNTNSNPKRAVLYGGMAQRLSIKKNQLYRITLWAQGKNISSSGAVLIIVDKDWVVFPIVFPTGTFPWQKLQATFSLPVDSIEFRILSQDAGEAWLDDISVVPLVDELY